VTDAERCAEIDKLTEQLRNLIAGLSKDGSAPKKEK